jgi:hypothetical protein
VPGCELHRSAQLLCGDEASEVICVRCDAVRLKRAARFCLVYPIAHLPVLCTVLLYGWVVLLGLVGIVLESCCDTVNERDNCVVPVLVGLQVHRKCFDVADSGLVCQR